MKKKSLVLALSFIFVFACCLFAGCTGNLNKYEINVKAQGYNLGSVEGGNSIYTEGESVTIKAVPVTIGSNKSEFFCWLKNDKVVSTEAQYTFVASKDTAGDYVALFTCPYPEFFSLNEIALDSGIAEQDNSTMVKKIEIYLGKVENLLTSVYSVSSDTFDKNITLVNADIYKEDKMPYAYNIQNDIFVRIDVTYLQDEVEFVSTTKSKITKTNDVTQENIKLENLVLSQGVNVGNEDLKLNLGGNRASISLRFDRLIKENFNFVTEDEGK